MSLLLENIWQNKWFLLENLGDFKLETTEYYAARQEKACLPMQQLLFNGKPALYYELPHEPSSLKDLERGLGKLVKNALLNPLNAWVCPKWKVIIYLPVSPPFYTDLADWFLAVSEVLGKPIQKFSDLSLTEKKVYLVYQRGQNLVELVLNQSYTSLGSSDEAHRVLKERGISRKHCCIRQVDETFLIEDLGSRNGTYLNGERLEPHRPYTFCCGDCIRLASLELEVRSLGQKD